MIFFLHTINSGFAKENLYNLSDLEVLEKDKNFEEFLLHVNDIRPSERSKHWREMYQHMSISLIDYKIKIKDFTRSTFTQIEQLSRSSALATDEFFQLKRSLYAKKYFTECFKATALISEAPKAEVLKNQCETEINSYWYFSKKDPDIGLDIAAILETNQSGVKLWPFYEKAANDSIANFYCQKPKIQEAVLKKLYDESFSAEFDGNYKTLIGRIVPDTCFNEMVPSLKNALLSNKTTGLDKEMAMNLLESKGKLTNEELDLYSVLYLLDGPVVGDKMNIAWKKVEALSESYEKRQKLLAQMEKIPLLPDRIFKDPNLSRNKAIINLFARNFPEYLNYYGSTCIKLIKNEGSEALNLSSSFQCHEFLKAAKATSGADSGSWVSDSIKTQYSATIKP